MYCIDKFVEKKNSKMQILITDFCYNSQTPNMLPLSMM